MHVLIVIVLAALLIWGAVYLSVTALASVGHFLAMPSIIGMGLLHELGLTDPIWSVVLHAALGGFLGFWAHLARPRRVKILLLCTVISVYIFTLVVIGLS